MNHRALQMRLGIGAILAAVFLMIYAIPNWVSSPSNVRNIVLSPLFWPYILGALTGLMGLGLVLSGWRAAAGEPVNEATGDPRAGALRLVAFAVLTAVTFRVMPQLGMVWTSMLAFLALAFLVRTRHPAAAVICAVVVPLILYAFFAHVASVAIPQGELVRLP
ncbi:MAG: tripartite tricarboxylate transporter TctB family protein [Roseovarius sp.]|nr:tripartite tricarboxylate transporter TctB family protein [Roseovarius sp.]